MKYIPLAYKWDDMASWMKPADVDYDASVSQHDTNHAYVAVVVVYTYPVSEMADAAIDQVSAPADPWCLLMFGCHQYNHHRHHRHHRRHYADTFCHCCFV